MTSIPRRFASARTSSITGSAPWAPVPTISRSPPQGISSPAESGVCPHPYRNCLKRAFYLHEHGVQVCGVDLSAELVERAHRLTPGIEFRQGDMMALDIPDGTWAGVAAFYSIIHIPRGDMARALSELRRVLRPGGLLLLSFHIGHDTIHLDDWWGHKVCVDFFFFRSAEIQGYLTVVGLEVVHHHERAPA